MSHTLILELPDELYQPLLQAASNTRQTPEEWLVANLHRQFALRDEKLRRHFGAVDLGAPTGADNRSIDADLARAYADTHRES